MKFPSKTRLDKSYAHHHPGVWGKTAEATTCLVALQALVLKPQDKVDDALIDGLIDATIANLRAIKDILDRELINGDKA